MNRCLSVCMCSLCMPDIQGGQKRGLNPLEQEVQMVINHHVGSGNGTCVLCKSTKCSELLSLLSSPYCAALTFLSWRLANWFVLQDRCSLYLYLGVRSCITFRGLRAVAGYLPLSSIWFCFVFETWSLTKTKAHIWLKWLVSELQGFVFVFCFPSLSVLGF